MGRIADESDFLELLIANERVAKLLDGVTSSFNGPRGMQALLELRECVKERTAYAEEAHRLGAVKILTRLLAKTADDAMLDAISDIITSCAGSMACPGKMSVYAYEGVSVRIKEGALGDGLGAKIWAAAHVMCKELLAHPEIVRGRDVLEIGSGCGLCGIVAAKLGSSHVTMSDCEGPVLQLLRTCMHLNSSAAAASTQAPQQAQPQQVQQAEPELASSDGSAATATAHDFTDAELFDDAESVEDFDLLADFASPAAGAATGSMCGGSSSSNGSSQTWESDNMSVVFLDWRDSMDCLDEGAPRRRSCDEARQGALGNSCAAPTVLPSQRYSVIIGSEVMYEPAHAVLVAAVVAHRLAPGGRAFLSCAVRCLKTFVKLDAECVRRGLRCQKKNFSPMADYGVDYNGVSVREEEYEGGHVLLALDHASSPAHDWHRDDFCD